MSTIEEQPQVDETVAIITTKQTEEDVQTILQTVAQPIDTVEQTTSTFIKEKLANFQQFLLVNLPNEGLRDQVKLINSLSMPLIYAWITDELKVQPDLDQYIIKLFAKYDIDQTNVDAHVIEKVKRYFECFISCV